MCGRDEMVREANEAERQLVAYEQAGHVAARVEACASTQLSMAIDRIEALENELRKVRRELSIVQWTSDVYRAQLECIETARWFRLGRRLLGFKPLRPLADFPDLRENARA